MPRLIFMVTAGAAMLLAGCIGFKNKPLSPSATAAAFAGRTLHDPGLHTFLAAHTRDNSWRRGAWNFDSLTLAALYFHPNLDVVRAQRDAADAAIKTAGELPNPTVTWTPGYNATSTGISPWIVGYNLEVPIETGGKRNYRRAQARQLAEAARLGIASAAWEVRSRVRAALVALESARALDTLVREQEGVQGEVVRLLELERGAGAISPIEVTRARVALDTARLARADAQASMSDALHQLAAAVGIPESALAGENISFPGFHRAPDLPSRAARRQALLNRPDLLASLAEYAASQSELQLAIAKQYPDLHLGPGYELDQTENKYQLGLSLELPVFNQHRGVVREAEAKRRQSAAKFIALQAKVIGDVDRAAAAYRGARDKRALAGALREKLEKQATTVRAMIEAGEVAKLDLATAQLELNTNALARLDAETKMQLALGQLEDAMQSPAALPESLWAANPRKP
jgi:outer membrane protein TolC